MDTSGACDPQRAQLWCRRMGNRSRRTRPLGEDILAGTVFDDAYWLAALALGLVGIIQLVAVIAHLKRSPWMGALHAFAGMTMMVFLFVEVLIIDEYFFCNRSSLLLGPCR